MKITNFWSISQIHQFTIIITKKLSKSQQNIKYFYYGNPILNSTNKVIGKNTIYFIILVTENITRKNNKIPKLFITKIERLESNNFLLKRKCMNKCIKNE